MNTILFVIYVGASLLALINLGLELRRMLMMLQQNSYRNERFGRWLSSSSDSTSTPKICAMIVFFASLVRFSSVYFGMFLVMAFAIANMVSLLRARYKKPLVWTKRVWRLFAVSVLLSTIAIFVALGLFDSEWYVVVALTAVVLYIGSSAVVMLANNVLEPVEKHINRGFYKDAEQILRSMPRLKVIGITGSYGKTSTKHYLHRILSEKYDVCMTPGSYNTTLGVVRTVREYLKPYNEVFIVEMGAKQIGDIKEICDLVHPQIGIVTAVGEQHLESFGSIENVQRTKFELVDALPSDGLAVVNDDFPFVASRQVDNVVCRRYGIESRPEVDYHVEDIVYSASGTDFTIVAGDFNLRLHTKLVGECNLSNLVAAVIVAVYMEVPSERIRYAVEKIEQVEHRLNVKRTAGGITIIDDAFNSNPTGSGMALDVLAGMKGGKRIVVTPGMIELGSRQELHNHNFGRKIAESADIAIVVGRYNRDAIMAGIAEVSKLASDKVYPVENFNEAQQLLSRIIAPGDVVLYENDLPDTFK